MMRLILSSWETLLDSLTQSTPTFMLKEKVAGNNGFACGSIPQHPSTPIQLFGILKGSCKPFSSIHHLIQFTALPEKKKQRETKILLLSSFFSLLLLNEFLGFFLLIRFLVDNIPIRVFNNQESNGVPYPKNQAMRVYCSLWNADDWATQGGRVKTDWALAPFTVSYRNFNANGCVKVPGSSACGSTNSLNNDQAWQSQGLDAKGRNRIRWVQQKFMIYNYCSDATRFPQGFPTECRGSRF